MRHSRSGDDRTGLVSITGLGAFAVALTFAVPAAAQIGPIQTPKVQLPSVQVPGVQVPSVQVPSVQVPSVQVPSLPPPPAAPPALPAPHLGLPSVQAPASPAGGSLRLAPLGSGVPGAPGAQPGGPSAQGGQSGANGKRPTGIAGTHYQTREDLVRRLRGCVDNLPRLQRAVIVLRYGIGPAKPRSRARTAQALGVSRTRAGHLERAGVRSLARDSRRTNCENTGVATSTMFDVARIVNGPDFLLAAAGMSGDGGTEPISDVIAVKSAHASSSDEGRPRDGGAGDSSAPDTPFLSAPFGGIDGPGGLLLAVLLATVAISLAVAARALVRAER